MSRGYICIAQNSKYDYLNQAYALALSLKATQQENAICVCVDASTKTQITGKHKEVFDHIVDIPWNDDAGADERDGHDGDERAERREDPDEGRREAFHEQTSEDGKQNHGSRAPR